MLDGCGGAPLKREGGVSAACACMLLIDDVTVTRRAVLGRLLSISSAAKVGVGERGVFHPS